jgi:nicotinamide-nucleotide amidase
LISTAADVVRLLTVRGETLAIAESLTGGMVASAVTAVPGASKAFRGSVTAYATELKRQVLGVDAELLAARGAVDPQVAAQMAAGVRTALGADWGIATTGSRRPGTAGRAARGNGLRGRGRAFRGRPGLRRWRKSGGAAVERRPRGNSYGECTERTRTSFEGACERTDRE